MDLQAAAPSPDARAGPDLLNFTLQSQAGDVSAQVEEERAGERSGEDGKVAGTARTESSKHVSMEKQEANTSPYSPVRRAPAKSSKTDTFLENTGIGLVFDIDFNKFQSPRPTPPPSREGKRTLAASSPRTARSRASRQSLALIKAPTTLAEACGLEASKPVAIHVLTQS